MNEHAHVDYDLLHPSIAAIRVENIHIEIATNVECAKGKTPALEIPTGATQPSTLPGKESKTSEDKEPGPNNGHPPTRITEGSPSR